MRIALTGFMACGKTTLGRAAAARLGLPFFDLDAEITRTYASPAELFAQVGEAGFRKIESEVLRDLLSREGEGILSLGGGTVLSEENRTLLRAACRVIWIDAPMELIWQRLSGSGRPLADGRSLEELSALRQAREGAYRAAAHAILRVEPDETREQTLRRLLALMTRDGAISNGTDR